MSTIQKLAELAKGATQGPDVKFRFYDHGGARLAKFAGERVLIADFYNEADSQYYFHCNPAAIAQAHAEYKAVSECADNAQREVVKLLAERAELERRNAELVEALRAAHSDLAALIPKPSMARAGDWPCENEADRACMQSAYSAIHDALAQSALPLEGKQEKADAAE